MIGNISRSRGSSWDRPSRVTAVLAVGLSSVLPAGCGGGLGAAAANDAAPAKAGSGALQDVTFLNVLPLESLSFAPELVADAVGFFKKEGLNVTFQITKGSALPFDVDSEAIFAANDSWSGLCASVWTKDVGRGVALTSQLQAGCCWINGHGAGYVDHRAPFGGFRSSGMGREFGIEGVREFTDHRAVSIVRSAGH